MAFGLPGVAIRAQITSIPNTPNHLPDMWDPVLVWKFVVVLPYLEKELMRRWEIKENEEVKVICRGGIRLRI